MRINYKNFPILRDLEELNPWALSVDNGFVEDNVLKNPLELRTLVEGCVDIYRQHNERYWLTNPFVEAIAKASPKIVKDGLHLKYKQPKCGLLIINKSVVMYLSNPSDEKAKLVLYGFSHQSITSFGAIMHSKEDPNSYLYSGRFYELGEDGKPFNNLSKLQSWLESVAIALYFIDNCELESKVIQANKKERFVGEKYLNETSKEMTLLNCSWFTELIRDTPFTVNGHLRWQPCGEKNSKRKLIWIDGFEKKGYNRKPIKNQKHDG